MRRTTGNTSVETSSVQTGTASASSNSRGGLEVEVLRTGEKFMVTNRTGKTIRNELSVATGYPISSIKLWDSERGDPIPDNYMFNCNPHQPARRIIVTVDCNKYKALDDMCKCVVQ